MVNPGLSVKGLPAGWRILQMAKSANNPQDAYVLCERDPPRPHDMNFVTWYANLQMGGCHLGFYVGTLDQAERDFAKRRATLR